MGTVDPNRRAIVFSDFDGTITLTDSNDYLTDNFGCGYEKRRSLHAEILAGRMSFRDAFHAMLGSVSPHKTIAECRDILVSHIQLDPGFKVFYDWCKARDVPVIILSSGMEPLIRALLEKLLGADDPIEIVANGIREWDGGWEIVFHDESHFGHDKSRTIKPFREAREKLPEGARKPVFFYCGDGISDLSAARETDLLFAKAGHDLIAYCKEENVPYTVFNDFSDIMRGVKSVVEGGKTAADVAMNR